MFASHISTKENSFYTSLPEHYKTLVKNNTPFIVHMSVGGDCTFPIPFINGRVVNSHVEQCVRNVLLHTFGNVKFADTPREAFE